MDSEQIAEYLVLGKSAHKPPICGHCTSSAAHRSRFLSGRVLWGKREGTDVLTRQRPCNTSAATLQTIGLGDS